jgi:hypothetical protein
MPPQSRANVLFVKENLDGGYFDLKASIFTALRGLCSSASYKDLRASEKSPSGNCTFQLDIDKVLLTMGGSIWGLFFVVNGYFGDYFYIEKQGMAMRLEEEGGLVAALFRNHPIFLSSYPPRRHFGRLRKAFLRTTILIDIRNHYSYFAADVSCRRSLCCAGQSLSSEQAGRRAKICVEYDEKEAHIEKRRPTL